MIKIRLQRHGKRNYPVYRIVVADSRWRRDGKVIEVLGHYNPKIKEDFNVNLDRYEYWVSKGAQPTSRVVSIVKLQRKLKGGN